MTRKIPKELTEMSEQWKQLKETIIEIRDNNDFEHEGVTLLCQFLTNYMDILEREASYTPQPKMGHWINKDEYFEKQDMLEELEEYARSQGDAWDKSVVDGAIDIIKSYCGGDEE